MYNHTIIHNYAVFSVFSVVVTDIGLYREIEQLVSYSVSVQYDARTKNSEERRRRGEKIEKKFMERQADTSKSINQKRLVSYFLIIDSQTMCHDTILKSTTTYESRQSSIITRKILLTL